MFCMWDSYLSVVELDKVANQLHLLSYFVIFRKQYLSQNLLYVCGLPLCVFHFCQEINPSLEIDMSNLLIHINRCITVSDDYISYDIILSSDLHLSFTVTSKLSGLPFCWKFYAAPVSLDMVSFSLSWCMFCHACLKYKVKYTWICIARLRANASNALRYS